MCRFPRRCGRRLRRRRRGLPAAHRWDSDHSDCRGCAHSFWSGSCTFCHLRSAFRIGSKARTIEIDGSIVRRLASLIEKDRTSNTEVCVRGLRLTAMLHDPGKVTRVAQSQRPPCSQWTAAGKPVAAGGCRPQATSAQGTAFVAGVAAAIELPIFRQSAVIPFAGETRGRSANDA
jgi:hypothetical protein